MEYIPEQATGSTGVILCCNCGVEIEPNPANMCVACIRSQVDITEGIPKTGTLYFCKACERYQQPPSTWVKAALESRDLLSVCLKRIKGLNKVRLVDAGFIWTEPHSKRIKVKLSIQKEVLNGAVLQQVFIVEFTVQSVMCDDCHRVEAKDFWRAVVQIRQKTEHKGTLYYLEQVIIKYNAHENTTNIKTVHGGLDFYYSQKQDARKLVDFLQTVVPCRYKVAEQLISHDIRNNTYNYKHSFSLEIVPVCKNNIVCLPNKLAKSLGNMGQICICHRVTTTVHLIDPNTCQLAEVNGSTFWRYPFQSLCQPKQLQEYIVMDVQLIPDKERRHVAGASIISQKHALADVWVTKSSELGSMDNQYHCRTHLGHVLSPGDTVLCFDLNNANVNDENFDSVKPERRPDVVLVKKLYSNPEKRRRRRRWKLKHLDLQLETGSQDNDYNDFLEDLEEDPNYRQQVNIYKDATKLTVEKDSDDEDDAPKISLQEMLEDLQLTDATGGAGDPMME